MKDAEDRGTIQKGEPVTSQLTGDRYFSASLESTWFSPCNFLLNNYHRVVLEQPFYTPNRKLRVGSRQLFFHVLKLTILRYISIFG